ncbi:hypothetical protein CYD26_17540 [Pseudomonas sp. FFUP_PS_473]|nr:hypothetical protein CYD26_17540 [Pseudomonas sp. FFUP_PS_473]
MSRATVILEFRNYPTSAVELERLFGGNREITFVQSPLHRRSGVRTREFSCSSVFMVAVRGQAYAWPVSKLAGFSPRAWLPPIL